MDLNKSKDIFKLPLARPHRKRKAINLFCNESSIDLDDGWNAPLNQTTLLKNRDSVKNRNVPLPSSLDSILNKSFKQLTYGIHPEYSCPLQSKSFESTISSQDSLFSNSFVKEDFSPDNEMTIDYNLMTHNFNEDFMFKESRSDRYQYPNSLPVEYTKMPQLVPDIDSTDIGYDSNQTEHFDINLSDEIKVGIFYIQ